MKKTNEIFLPNTDSNIIYLDKSGLNSKLSKFYDSGIELLLDKETIVINIKKTLTKSLYLISIDTDIKLNLSKDIQVNLIQFISNTSNYNLSLGSNTKLNMIFTAQFDKANDCNFIINLGKNANLDLLSFYKNKSNSSLQYTLSAKEYTKLDIKNLIHNYKDFKLNIKAHNSKNNSDISVLTKSVLFEKSNTELYALSLIDKNLINVQNNIIFQNLASKKIGQLKITPAQDINSVDIKASHGMAFGSFNPDFKWYLATFGLSEYEIYLCLLNAFENDIFQNIEDSELQKSIKQFLGSEI